MRTLTTLFPAGMLVLVTACSSTNTPTKGNTGGGAAVGTGAKGSGTGATGNSSGAPGTGTSGTGTTDPGANGSGATGTGVAGSGTGSVGNGVGGGPGQNTGGAAAAPPGTGTGLTSSIGGGTSSGSGGSNANSGGACADVTSQSQQSPPVLEFVIDVTGSMNNDAYPADTANNNTKWQEMLRVLPGAFAALPPSWAVGVTYFNRPTTCYQGVQAVPIGPMTAAQANAIRASIVAALPNGYTPTLAAWRFGLAQLQSWAAPAAYLHSPRYIVLITDGVPTVTRDACTIENPITQPEYDYLVSAVKTEGEAARIETFVVGVLGSEEPQGAVYDPLYMLSQVAVAGGTPQPANCTPVTGQPSGTTVSPRGTYCHFDMTTNPDFAGGLTSALQAIASQVISCSYSVPPPPPGLIIDPVGITVTYTPGTGGARALTKASSSACTDGQWYISAQDSSGIATQIDFCTSTCDTVSNDNGAQISVTFKCIGQL